VTKDAAEPVTIGKETVEPGRSRQFDLRFARLPTGTWESIPISIINGRKPGPTIWLSGAVHGDEINGVEIIRRVLPKIEARKLAGTVIAVPVVNVFGFLNQARNLPDRRDLNRSFPGSNRGSLASRLAHLFMKEVVSKCQYGIDIHTAAGHRINLPQVRADLKDAETFRLAEAFGAPVAIHAKVRDGSLRQAATELGIKVVLYETGSVQRFEEQSVATGVLGILRMMQALGMGTWDTPPPARPPLIIHKTTWVRANRSGILTLRLDLGDTVEAGQRIGTVGDALGGRPTLVKAHASGTVIARTLNPLVSQGDALVHIAVPRADGKDEPAVRRRLD
jgi:uncharacterized protein